MVTPRLRVRGVSLATEVSTAIDDSRLRTIHLFHRYSNVHLFLTPYALSDWSSVCGRIV